MMKQRYFIDSYAKILTLTSADAEQMNSDESFGGGAVEWRSRSQLQQQSEVAPRAAPPWGRDRPHRGREHPRGQRLRAVYS